ncbi:MAG: hypothetical protein M1816_001794 [Peltula sp. TS41687]|nr:MAG: hypothetical protein M1816_001794 [Peltula sp. TS41687]
MKNTMLGSLLYLSAGLVAAQVTQDPSTGAFTCSGYNPSANYCAGESQRTNIIFRCNNGIAQPGNCNDNLAGVPPVGVKSAATCYESSPTAGDAACSFNCVVYRTNDTFTIPGCTPSVSSSSTTSTSEPVTVISDYFTTTTSEPITTITDIFPTSPSEPITAITDFFPTASSGMTAPTDTGGPLYPTGNNATAAPTGTGVSPPSVLPSGYIGGATMHKPGGFLAAVGGVVAMMALF